MLALTIDGFLRNDAHKQSDDGVKIYAGLCEAYRVVLLTDDHPVKAEYWLKSKGLSEHAMVIGHTVLRRNDSLRIDQIDHLRTEGPVGLVIDPDPAVMAYCLSVGIPGMLYLHPQYSRPEFRPDAPAPRSWDQINAELDRQSGLLSQDKRITEDFEKEFED